MADQAVRGGHGRRRARDAPCLLHFPYPRIEVSSLREGAEMIDRTLKQVAGA
ncbi:MAG: hypothetical protein ACRDYX_17920 [Egibacteraceae bacterium]